MSLLLQGNHRVCVKMPSFNGQVILHLLLPPTHHWHHSLHHRKQQHFNNHRTKVAVKMTPHWLKYSTWNQSPQVVKRWTSASNRLIHHKKKIKTFCWRVLTTHQERRHLPSQSSVCVWRPTTNRTKITESETTLWRNIMSQQQPTSSRRARGQGAAGASPNFFQRLLEQQKSEQESTSNKFKWVPDGEGGYVVGEIVDEKPTEVQFKLDDGRVSTCKPDQAYPMNPQKLVSIASLYSLLLTHDFFDQIFYHSYCPRYPSFVCVYAHWWPICSHVLQPISKSQPITKSQPKSNRMVLLIWPVSHSSMNPVYSTI